MTWERFRKLLVERETEIEREISIGREGARSVELDPARVGRLSRMDALQSQALGAEAQKRRQLNLSRIRAAIQRLDAGDYGDCADCGEPIPERRLEHDPATTVCVDCARAR